MNKDHLARINYDKIINDNSLHFITRMTALNLRINPYSTVGDFFNRLARRELYQLHDMVMSVEDGEEESIDDLLLLCEMLSNAEGIFSSCIDEIYINLNLFCVMVRSVVMHKKGELVVNFENLSFGSEYYDSKPFINHKQQ